MKRFLVAALGAGVALLLSACAPTEVAPQPPGPSEVKSISGTVFYRERILLPPGAVVEVILEDVSRQDVAATEITTARIIVEQGPPWQFELLYDASLIKPGHRYNVRAKIRQNGRLTFISDQHYDAFGEAPLDILVKRVPDVRKRPNSHGSVNG